MPLPALERCICTKNQFFYFNIKFHAFTRSRARFMHEKAIFLVFHKISCIYPLSSELHAWKTKLYFIFIKFHAFTRSQASYMHEKHNFISFSLNFMHLLALKRVTCMKNITLFHFHKISCLYPLSKDVYARKINFSILT